jgi:hypothetical protein
MDHRADGTLLSLHMARLICNLFGLKKKRPDLNLDVFTLSVITSIIDAFLLNYIIEKNMVLKHHRNLSSLSIRFHTEYLSTSTVYFYHILINHR